MIRPTSPVSSTSSSSDSSSDEEVESTVKESQPMSIHKIDPQKILAVFDMKPTELQIELFDLIQRVMALYNQQIGKTRDTSQSYQLIDDRVHPLTEDPVFPSFRMAIFAQKTQITTRLANWVHELQPSFHAVKQSAEFVFFLYRYTGPTPHTLKSAEIFALTTGHAWRAVEKFRDYTFPAQIARRWFKPELSGQTKRPLLGRVLLVAEIFKQETKPTKSEVIDQLIMRMKTSVRPQAAVFGLQFVQRKKTKNPLVTVGSGMIRFGQKTWPQDYVPVIDFCARISRGEKTYLFDVEKKMSLKAAEEDSEEFDYLDYLQPASIADVHRLNRALDTLLWKAYKKESALPILDFCHKFISDYFFSGDYILYYKNKKIDAWSHPKTAAEMIGVLQGKVPSLEGCKSVETFATELAHVQVGFQCGKGQEKALFRDYFEGEICLDNGTTFWRLRNMWYVVQADYLSLIQQEFCAFLKEVLLPPDHPAALKKPFSLKKDEADYNKQYIDEPNFVFGDGVCPHNMELFDLALFLKDDTYVIQLKKGLNKDIRTGCSQIRNAAKNLKEKRHQTTSDIIKRFYDLATGYKGQEWHRLKLKKQMEVMGYKAFAEYFKKKKVVFVYAVVDDVRVPNRLHREKDLDLQMNAQRIGGFHKDFEKEADGIYAELLRQDFLTKKGYPSTKFLAASQERFAQEFSSKYLASAAKKELFKAIKGHTSLLSSNVAKLELLRLRNELEEMGFELKICQVPLEKDSLPADPTSWTEEERAVLSKLPDVGEAHLYQELEEGDTFALAGKPYKICTTKADSACGLHALIGEWDKIKEKYIFTETGFFNRTFANIREVYWAILKNPSSKCVPMLHKLFNGMLRQYLGSYPTNEAKLLFDRPEFETAMLELKKELYACDQEWDTVSQSEIEFFKNLSTACPTTIFEQILEKMREDVSLKDFKQKYVSNASLFVSLCTEHRKQILTLLTNTDLGAKLAEIQSDKEEVRLDKEDFIKQFYKQNAANILTVYGEVCQREGYYYSDIELGMIASACDIKLTIVPHRLLLETGDPITYGDEGEEVVLFHKGNHYSRCSIVEKKRKREN